MLTKYCHLIAVLETLPGEGVRVIGGSVHDGLGKLHIMRTNIVIDDKLMRDTLRATGLKTKRGAVELGPPDRFTLVSTGGDQAVARAAGLARRSECDEDGQRLILVDSSVWIDYFEGAVTDQTKKLDDLQLGSELLATGDLILTEVLQGFAKDTDFNRAQRMLTSLTVVALGGEEIGD